MSVNKVILLGNLGRDPEVTASKTGRNVARLSLATGRKFKKEDGTPAEDTQWHRIDFWDSQADTIAKYVKKGDRLYVEGEIRYSEVTNSDGKKVYFTNIIGRTFDLIEKKNSSSDNVAYEAPPEKIYRSSEYGNTETTPERPAPYRQPASVSITNTHVAPSVEDDQFDDGDALPF
jgi:single-strand DNA-binding protein